VGQELGPQEKWNLIQATKHGRRSAGKHDPGVTHQQAPSCLPMAGPAGMSHPGVDNWRKCRDAEPSCQPEFRICIVCAVNSFERCDRCR
jgi:hypothetical protein